MKKHLCIIPLAIAVCLAGQDSFAGRKNGRGGAANIMPVQTLAESRGAEDNHGRFRRRSIVEADFKYPLLALEETVERDADTGEERMLRQQAHVADHVIVKVRSGTDEQQLRGVLQTRGWGIRKKMYARDHYLVALNDAGLDSVSDAIHELGFEWDTVEFVGRDYVVHSRATLPDDSRFDEMWGLDNTGQSGGTADADIDAAEAWDLETGTSAIRVAVVDTGLDYNHYDLAANVWTNPNETLNGIDDDGNGLVDDVRGWDFADDDNDPMEAGDQHGTHCSGTIGAVGNNATGTVGVCWNVSLIGVRGLGINGGASSDLIDAVTYATDIGADVISASYGGYGYNQSVSDSIARAGASNVLFVAAAGNDSIDNDLTPHYPSSYELDNIIAVAASDRNEQLAGFSNYGINSVDLTAPGVAILSTVTNHSFASWNGTSMACPHVSGAAALVWSFNPSLSALEVKSILLDSVEVKPAYMGKVATAGRLNVHRALQVAMGEPKLSVSPASFSLEVPEGGTLADASFDLWNSGASNLSYTLSVSDSWMSLSPTNGSSAGEKDPVSIGLVTAGLAAGRHAGLITIDSPGAANAPKLVPVVLNVYVPTNFVSLTSSNPIPPYASWATAATNIQDAVDMAGNGQTVLVGPGHYYIDDPVNIQKSLVLAGSDGPAATILDSDGLWRCVTIAGTNCSVSGFTLTNGYDYDGAGIWCGSDSVTVSNCIITGNTALDDGGGVYGGLIVDSTITGNAANYGGGSIFADATACVFGQNTAAFSGGAMYGGSALNCVITSNAAQYGGGVYDGYLDQCEVVGNTGTNSGGGIRNSYAVETLIADNSADYGGGAYGSTAQDCLLNNNTAAYSGGGLYSGTCLDSALTNNTAQYGGGMYLGTMHRSTVYGNQASTGGGGVRSANVFDSEIRMNQAPYGGGFYSSTAYRCVIADNSADTTGGGMYGGTVYDSAFGTNTATYGAGAAYGTLYRCDVIGNIASYSGGGLTGTDATDCTIRGNSAQFGGGANNGELTRCTLAGNSASATGGGSYGSHGVECMFTNNTANYGGGIGYGEVERCDLVGNYATERGGGVYSSPATACLIHDNEAGYAGGGAAYSALTDCVVSDGSAQFGGGNILANATNTVFFNNSATTSGGAMYEGVAVHCTMADNSANYGGGQYKGSNYNSIVWYNTAPSGNNLYNGYAEYSCSPDLVAGVNGNITDVPVFVDRPTGNYNIFADSPCIDAGSNVYAAMPQDLDGNPRIFNGTADMGAYEYQRVFDMFVSLSGSGSPPYDSWSNAAPDIATALGAAAPGDVIVLAGGTYAPGSEIVVDKNITLVGARGAGGTIIDAQYASRCLNLGSTACTIEGLRLINGYSTTNGGAVWCSSYDPVLTNCVIEGAFCDGGAGGGIVFGTLYDCAITANFATGGGGGAYTSLLYNCEVGSNACIPDGGGLLDCSAYDTAVFANSSTNGNGGGMSGGVASNCWLNDNIALNGGGMNATVAYGCTISNNTALLNGGGVWDGAVHAGTVVGNTAFAEGGGMWGGTALDCTVQSNNAEYGGGVFDTLATNSWLVGNAADYGGGARDSTLVQCTVSSNTAAIRGGGLDLGLAYSCTVSHNVSAGPGGGMHGADAHNSLVAHNEANYGGGASSSDLYNCTVLYNVAVGSGDGTWAGRAYNSIIWYNSSDNSPEAPLFVDGCITNEPQFVDAAGGDFHLLPSSPCLNEGDNGYVSTLFDFEGNDRIQGAVDMGMFEHGYSSYHLKLSKYKIDLAVAVGNNLSNATFGVWNSGGNATLNYSVSDNLGWLSCLPVSGWTTGEVDEIDIVYDTAGLSLGQYSGEISVSSPEAPNSPRTIAVSLDVYEPVVSYLEWAPIAPYQTIGEPFPATLYARDINHYLVPSYIGNVGLSAVDSTNPAPPFLEIGAFTGPTSAIMGLGNADSRAQVIYPAVDLGGPMTIAGLSLFINGGTGSTVSNWTVRIKHTTMEDFEIDRMWEDGWETMHQSSFAIDAPGWMEFTFDVPFDYNGVDNIMVDFSFNNEGPQPGGGCRATDTLTRRTMFKKVDEGTFGGDPLLWLGNAPLASRQNMVPDIRLIQYSGDPVDITPTNTGSWAAGTWTGTITVQELGTNVTILAQDMDGNTSRSGEFAVLQQDGDSNGLPDAWEATYFGTNGVMPLANNDGDAYNNWEEYVLGSNPADGGSEWIFQPSAAPPAGDFGLELGTVPGRLYTIECTDNLVGGNWNVVTSFVGTGEAAELVDPAEESSCMFRVKIELVE
jgi:subtilisin family serine protease